MALAGLLATATVSAGPELSAPPAAAPRSVAGAQQLLLQLLPGNRYVSTPMSEMLDKARAQQLSARFEPLPLIVSAEPLAPCVTRLLADASASQLLLRNPLDADDASQASVAELMRGGDLIGNPEGMHFGQIRASSQQHNRVYLRFAGNTADAVVHMEAAESASRVLAAVDYLRHHCDPSRATGF